MPTINSPAGSERDPNEFSEGLDNEMSEEDRDELFEKLNANRQEIQAENLITEEIIEENRKSVTTLLNEVAVADKMGDLSNPDNPAQVAVKTMIAQGEEPLIFERRAFEKVGGGLEPEDSVVILKKLYQELNITDETVDQKDNPRKRWSKKKITAVITGILLIAGLAAYLILDFASKNKKAAHGKPAADDQALGFDATVDDPTEASQTFVSLLMQAASDAPYNSLAFKDFGISEQTYQSLRQQLLVHRDGISEEAHWQIMAQQTTTVFPPTGKAYTLGDHMLALQIQFNLLEPLYDSQPLDLDLDTTISALAEQIDLKAEIPIEKLYTSMMDLVPESSGANRLQRLVLARMAIARAIAKAHPSA